MNVEGKNNAETMTIFCRGENIRLRFASPLEMARTLARSEKFMLLNFQKVSIMCLCLLSLRGCGDGSDIKNRGLTEMQFHSSTFKYYIRHISPDDFKSASHLKRSVKTKSITETYMVVYSLQYLCSHSKNAS